MPTNRILIFELDDGGKVAVEADRVAETEERISSTRDDVVDDTGKRFSEAIEGIEGAAKQVLTGFATALEPQELQLSFGLKFSAKAGMVIASADAEATMVLKATWKPTNEGGK